MPAVAELMPLQLTLLVADKVPVKGIREVKVVVEAEVQPEPASKTDRVYTPGFKLRAMLLV